MQSISVDLLGYRYVQTSASCKEEADFLGNRLPCPPGRPESAGFVRGKEPEQRCRGQVEIPVALVLENQAWPGQDDNEVIRPEVIIPHPSSTEVPPEPTIAEMSVDSPVRLIREP